MANPTEPHRITERCSCGATMDCSSNYLPFVLQAADEFRRAHAHCRGEEPSTAYVGRVLANHPGLTPPPR